MEFEKIQTIIAGVLDVEADDITEETTFEELDADSLDLFQIITELEEEFGIEIPAEEADQIRTVGDAVQQIRNSSL
ncbi:MAG: acyl carrier protein [Clostridiales bacterium]|nr:acyl carrier protein [Lachnospiraceae bacterium]MCD8046850.1 acyl carrier protein [Clostridiales bacterium]MCD8152409.1 acyl carrier protein [Clostridiales bacterium]